MKKRVSPDISQTSYDIIKASAVAQDRSVNWLIAKILNDWADSQSKPKKAAKKVKTVAVVDESEIIGQLILNDGNDFDVSQNYFNELVRLYPAVNMSQEFNNIKGWLIANPTKRKTRTGIKRFINTWVAKQQDKGGKNVTANQSNADRAKTAAQSTLSSYDDFMVKNG